MPNDLHNWEGVLNDCVPELRLLWQLSSVLFIIVVNVLISVEKYEEKRQTKFRLSLYYPISSSQ